VQERRACTTVLGVADVTDDESRAWRMLGTRGLYENSEASLSEVDVELPTRERVWLPVVRLPRVGVGGAAGCG
jgi:hypothetical protein